jgi:hypothetical protein
MEGKWILGGRMARSPEVVEVMEWEGREGKKKEEEEEESFDPNVMPPKGASLGGALL